MKKGFTLIELLAVIVILAIIALIATPIVLDIIEDSKNSSTLRSAEMYLDAVELSVANATLDNNAVTDGTYNILDTGDICLKYDSENKCSNILEVEVNGESPSSGTITISNGVISDVSLDLNNKTIVKNEDGSLVYGEKEETEVAKTLDTICTYDSTNGVAEKTVGAKYSCDFGAGERNFYILELGSNPVTDSTLNSDEVALILEGNYDTTMQAWCDQTGANPSNSVCNADGLTSKLDEIASAWTKLQREQIGLPSIVQIVVADGQSEDAYLDFPLLTNSWLYNWDNSVWGDTVFGYWTSTPNADPNYYDRVYRVNNHGYAGLSLVHIDSSMGIRPVVNLKI